MPRTRSRGFTLIELMVAMVVSAIVVLGIFAFSTIQQSTTGIHQRNVRVQQALEGAMWSIGQDVRSGGMGWARLCTELRVWDNDSGRLINPGGDPVVANTLADATTGARYWVLRDGIQAHWDSTGTTDLVGSGSSAFPDSAADAFDVVVAEPNYTGSVGVFTMATDVLATDTVITVDTGPLLDNTVNLAEVQQLFPPGSFIIMANVPATFPFRVEAQRQCPLLQVTGEVQPGATANQWQIPIANTSGFNANLQALLIDDPGGDEGVNDDWVPGSINVAGSSIIPLGRLRWSRYEIDYTVANFPYLVRYDLIGYIDGVDPTGLGAFDYPHCAAGTCSMAQLHLPGGNVPPRGVAIGPMIEDMQVVAGCDGYTAAGVASVDPPVSINNPDVGFEEPGPTGGPFPGVPNGSIDENASGLGRNADEWLGNAVAEQFAPDCVYYGTAEYEAANWPAVETALTPAFRMSPQALRVTLLASSEFDEEAGGLSTPNAQAIEDRPQVTSPVGPRQRFTLTETFSPDNLRWRDPRVE
jgi:prepilin-type N-terminal cleavage/methylation domain-containing protein